MLKEKLYEMKSNSEGIALFVIEDILAFNDSDEDITSYIDNVLTYGCVSGCVSSLTYYHQTKDLFSKHFEEILEIAEQIKEECDIDIELNANNLAWLAYEETVREIASELGIY